MMSDKKYKTVITALIALLFGLAIIFLFRDNSTISELNGLRIDYSMLETAYSNLKDENAELKVENEALKLQAQQQEESASSSTASSAISISTHDYRSDSTYSGSIRKLPASVRISSEKVAEKSRFWRFFGISLMMRLMS